MSRIAVKKSTGKMLEFQSEDAPLGTLKQNAINAGIPENDIEEKYVNEDEYKLLRKKWLGLPYLEPQISIIGTTVNILAGDFYYLGNKYTMQATGDLDFSNSKSVLWIEKVVTGADYLYDTTGYAIPTKFDGKEAVKVAWVENGTIEILT